MVKSQLPEEDQETSAIIAQPRNSTEVALGGMTFQSPVEMVQAAEKVACTLADIIDQQKLYSIIKSKKYPNRKPKKYVRVEGWTTCASMLGLVAMEKSVTKHENGVYEAVVELVRVSDGAVIGRGSGECGGPDDTTWADREAFAKRSMAVTRATGKACRLALSWIVKLAGYDTTPAEEIEGIANLVEYDNSIPPTTRTVTMKNPSRRTNAAIVAKEFGVPEDDIVSSDEPAFDVSCPACGGDMEYKDGISKKNGRPWAAFFCARGKEECGGVIWADPETGKPQNNKTSGGNRPKEGRDYLYKAFAAAMERAGMSKDEARGRLIESFGKDSLRDLTVDELGIAIAAMDELATVKRDHMADDGSEDFPF